MYDLVVNAIQNATLNISNLNFRRLHQFAAINSGEVAYKALDRGRITIQRQELLNQYLFSYGCMVSRQWHKIMPEVSKVITNDVQLPFQIYDYGCGQGLATMLFKELISGTSSIIKDVTLIEPSAIALQRAQTITSCILPNAKVTSYNQKLDDYQVRHGKDSELAIKVHLFSNVLDIPSFDQIALINKILEQKGTHYIVAVSNDRDCIGGTPRLKKLFDYLTSFQCKDLTSIRVSSAVIDRFEDFKRYKSVYFILKVKV